MQAIITRPMVIATDAGTAKQWFPKKDANGHVPQAMSESEFRRLERAGAARRFIEVVPATAEDAAFIDEHFGFANVETSDTVALLDTKTSESNPQGVSDPALNNDGKEVNFASMTKAELIVYAAEECVEIDATWKKAEIIAAIQGAQSAGN